MTSPTEREIEAAHVAWLNTKGDTETRMHAALIAAHTARAEVVGEQIAQAIDEVRSQVDTATEDWQHTAGKDARRLVLAALDDCIDIAHTFTTEETPK